jgi:uncharacterized iron-regulated membrane protein
VRAELVRTYKTVHTWTGIICGMALFIAFYAGGLTLFKEQLVEWATPPQDASAGELALADAQTLIARTLASHPEAARELELHVRRSSTAPDVLEWKVHEEGSDEHDTLSVRHFAATLASDGSARVYETHPSHLGEQIDVLHRVVGLPIDSDANRYFMGVIATLYFLALFSGLVTLLPSLLKDLFALRVGPNLKRMWLDAHNIVGLGSFPFHLAMAMTAAVFAFHDAIYFVQNSLIHEGRLGAAFGGPSGNEAQYDPAKMVPPAEIIARVTELAPRFQPTTLRYVRAKGPNPSLFVFGHDEQALEQRAIGGVAMVDPYSGRIVSTAYLPGKQSVAETLLSSLFAVHFGSFGGKPVKWMYFCLAMLGAWLVYSGNLLWIESRRKRQKDPHEPSAVQRRSARVMASATIGVCLGAVCGVSLTIVSAKWLYGHVDDLNAWHRTIYYGAFFAAIAWSFQRGGARAAVELLAAAALVTLAIPFTTIIATALPSLGMWAHREPSVIAVDLTALALGLVFAFLARKTARRVYGGKTDSVWSAHESSTVQREPSTQSDLTV